jgi:hypothetical protein
MNANQNRKLDLDFVGNEWRPKNSEVAVRLRQEEYEKKSIIVGQSQWGALIVDGIIQEEIRGKQELRSLLGALRDSLLKAFKTPKSISALICRRGSLAIDAAGFVKSADGHELSFDCDFAVEIESLHTFYNKYFDVRDLVVMSDLQRELTPALRQAVQRLASKCTASELTTLHTELGYRFIYEIEAALRLVATAFGLRVSFVRPPQFSSEALKQLLDRKAEFLNQLETAALQNEYLSKKSTIDKETYEINRRINSLKLDVEIDSLADDATLKKHQDLIAAKLVLDEIGAKEPVLKQLDEFSRRRREAKERQEDEETARINKLEDERQLKEHLRSIAELERLKALSALSYELKSQQVHQDGKLSQSAREQELSKLRDESEFQFAQVTHQLNLDKMISVAEREKMLAEHHAKLEMINSHAALNRAIRLDDAMANKTIADTELGSKTAAEIAADENERRKNETERLKLQGLIELQQGRLREMHELDELSDSNKFDREERRMKLEAEIALGNKKLDIESKRIELENRPKNVFDIASMATPEQLEGLAKVVSAQQGHDAKGAKEREALLRELMDVKESLLKQAHLDTKESNKNNEAIQKELVDRIQKMAEQAMQLLSNSGNKQGVPNVINVIKSDTQPYPNQSMDRDETIDLLKSIIDRLT